MHGLASVASMKKRWVLVGLVLVVVLAPALAMTLARIVQPSGGSWVRLVSFTPYAIVLYAVSVLLLLLAWLRGRGRWRSTARTLALVSVAGLAVHLWWASGPFFGGPTATAADQEPFTVMNANLMIGEASPSQVVSTAVRNDVDVVVLEEVTPQVLGGLQAAGIEKAYPHTAGEAAGGPAGTMVFSATELTSVTRLDTYYGGYSMKVEGPRGQVSLIAVHPRPPIGDATGWADDHAVLLKAAAAAVGPVIVSGDFNATPDHRQLHDLYAEGLSDAVDASTAGWQPTWPASGELAIFGIPVPSMLQIDHVLVSKDVRAVRTQTVPLAGTDHRAVIAQLKL